MRKSAVFDGKPQKMAKMTRRVGERMRAAFYTLGCKVNQYETEVIQRQFAEDGFTVVPFGELADVFVVNSCTVTSTGDHKTRQILRRIRRENPAAIIALTGCFPQAFPAEAEAVPEADVVTGASNRKSVLADVRRALAEHRRIVDIIPHEYGESFEPMCAEEFHEHTRAFVKIEDGCDRYCSYCIIPKARGPIRSKPLGELEKEIAALAKNGYREIVLVGINLSSYGKETGFAFRLPDAVELACSISGVERVRLGSLEPELLTDGDLDRFAAQPKFCPQFHLSLQSGCDETLRRMNRHYTAAEYMEIVGRIRARFDNPAITTDIMVGFPGETEEELAASIAFAEAVGFAKVHTFAYSVREGTRAADMPAQVPQIEKESRSRRMIAATQTLRQRFLESQLGLVQDVLFEQRRADGSYTGYTKNYTPVLLRAEFDPCGQIIPVRLLSLEGEACRAELVSAE